MTSLSTSLSGGYAFVRRCMVKTYRVDIGGLRLVTLGRPAADQPGVVRVRRSSGSPWRGAVSGWTRMRVSG